MILQIPNHIAIIMDGNGRWAKNKVISRSYGHLQGVETVERIIKTCMRLKVKCLILFAFSKKNWKKLLEKIDSLIDLTRSISRFTLVTAFNYFGRWNIIESFRIGINGIFQNKVKIDEADEKKITTYLSTKRLPEPDFIIRPAGVFRISNFFLWQVAYSELFFTNKPWPAFNPEDFLEAIRAFNYRERRYGNICEI
jgi:undecaprenyl diphosphate synthase